MKISQAKLIFFTSLFFILFDNYTFFDNLFTVYPITPSNIGFLISSILVLLFLTILVFILISSKYTIKYTLILVILISSFTTYFMNSYGTVIDTEMIRNTLQTDLKESLDLFSTRLVFYFIVFGLFPSYLIYIVHIEDKTLKQEISSKIKLIALSLLIISSCLFIYSKHYTSFFREHKSLRYNTNPTYWIYSVGKYISNSFTATSGKLKCIGADANIIEDNDSKKELVILVVGETARADHFSLNGYDKETNPLLKEEDIVNFSNMYSCGTSTAVSVPCMFSVFDKSDYDYNKGINTENVLDVLKHTGDVSILWRDNNSNSKGVALRVDYEDYKSPKTNTICNNGECRDEGMLIGLNDYINKHKDEDVLIILHQMGNHGPAYYKRYPKEFEKFKPACKTNQLEECSKEEINNAYDNALLYTDYFLSKTINFLKGYDKEYSTTMIYMSDHGESLGENGIYLHGMPYFMAPDAQTNVASLIWIGENMKKEINYEKLKQKKSNKYTQDNLFHILLGLFEVKTSLYSEKKDFIDHKF